MNENKKKRSCLIVKFIYNQIRPIYVQINAEI